MNHEQFAFANQQLAGMLKVGIPLEGALRQLAQTMQRGTLRSEFEAIEAALAAGTPLPQAVAGRQLPPLYVKMIEVGVQSQDLPGMLLLLADYYQHVGAITARLRGLMVYPMIVLFSSAALSGFLTVLLWNVSKDVYGVDWFGGEPKDLLATGLSLFGLWLPCVIILFLLGFLLIGVGWPRLRRIMRWRLPAFRESSLSQFAWAMHLMLKGGSTLDDGLGLMVRLEQDSPAGDELELWRKNIADGHAKFVEIATPGKAFPPLFVWIVANAEEDLARGFLRAAEIYRARALHRIEMLLYAALPVAVLTLGLLILSQVHSMAGFLLEFVRSMLAFR